MRTFGVDENLRTGIPRWIVANNYVVVKTSSGKMRCAFACYYSGELLPKVQLLFCAKENS